MKTSRILAIVAAVVLVALPLPMYLVISGLAVMALDSGGDSAWPWLFIGAVWGTSILVPIASLVGAIVLIRKGKLWAGIAASLAPAAIIGVFWLWLSQQSFS
jgi:hypothetical protein